MSDEIEDQLWANQRRPSLDRALSGEAFKVDVIACGMAASVIRNMSRQQQIDSPQPAPFSDLLFRMAQAAICHQMNWDFLTERLGQVFIRERLGAEELANVSARNVSDWLGGYHRPERVRAAERAALLRNLGDVLIAKYGGSPNRIVVESENKLSGPTGLIAALDEFDAFREDPLRKKSNVLVHEIVRDGIVRFIDEDTISPAIDYHIMRLYLRTGRVVPLHSEVLGLLKNDWSPRARLIAMLRLKVSEALALTAFYANLSVPIVNTIEWQMGRDVCDRIRPKCDHVSAEPKQDLFDKTGASCLYASFCQAYANPDWRKLREPDFKKSFY